MDGGIYILVYMHIQVQAAFEAAFAKTHAQLLEQQNFDTFLSGSTCITVLVGFKPLAISPPICPRRGPRHLPLCVSLLCASMFITYACIRVCAYDPRVCAYDLRFQKTYACQRPTLAKDLRLPKTYRYTRHQLLPYTTQR